jgi:DNA-binding GntR family transcriptional regulator
MTSPGPMYRQIADDLRTQILDGTLMPGAKLPSTDQIRQHYSVTVTVASQARQILIAEGLVEGRPGSGAYVRERPTLKRMSRTHYRRQSGGGSPFAEEQREAGREPSWTCSSETITAPPAIAERLAIEPGDPVMRTSYVFKADGRPVMLSTSWEPLALTGGTAIVLPESGPHAGKGVVDRMATIGVTVTEVSEDVGARAALAAEADQLAGLAGNTVLIIHRTYYDTNRRPVEAADIVLPSDRYTVEYWSPVGEAR